MFSLSYISLDSSKQIINNIDVQVLKSFQMPNKRSKYKFSFISLPLIAEYKMINANFKQNG